MDTIRLSDLADDISSYYSLSPNAAARLLKLLFHKIEVEVTSGNSVVIPGFGKFTTKRAGGQTLSKLFGKPLKKKLKIPVKRIPKFEASERFKRHCMERG